MNFLRITCVLILLSAMEFNSTADPTNSPAGVVEPGATLKKLSGDFRFTEGPTCDARGNVYFTDQPNNRILKWSVDGVLSEFLKPAGRANGMYFAPDGKLIACADEKNELWSIAPDGTHTVLAREFNGKPLNGPNDVWMHPNGGIYFTDPFYKRSWWEHPQRPQDGEHVYYLAPNTNLPQRVATDLVQPNGITGTPDGKTLFVADIKAGMTYAYDIQPDGTLAKKRLHCQLGSDGMTVDNEGHLFLTGDGVIVVDKSGKQVDHIKVPERWTANVSFGGKDRRTLFITASQGLYSIRTRTQGVNPAK